MVKFKILKFKMFKDTSSSLKAALSVLISHLEEFLSCLKSKNLSFFKVISEHLVQLFKKNIFFQKYFYQKYFLKNIFF